MVEIKASDLTLKSIQSNDARIFYQIKITSSMNKSHFIFSALKLKRKNDVFKNNLFVVFDGRKNVYAPAELKLGSKSGTLEVSSCRNCTSLL